MRRPPLLAVLALVIAACGGGADDRTAASPTDPLIAGGAGRSTFTAADGTRVPLFVVEPDGYRAGTEAPVLLAFPPGGQDAGTTARVLDRVWRDEATRRGWVVVSPQAPGPLWYEPEAARHVPALVAAISTRWPPEGGRVHLAGVSNGGLSAFRAAIDHPELFLDLVAYPGYPPAETDDVAALAGIPVAIWVGGDDAGWREAGEAAVGRLQAAGGTARITVVPGEGHILQSVGGADYLDFLERQRPAGA